MRLETDRRPVILTGANGVGKTNLLEAVSMFVPGRGLRGAAFEEMVRKQAPAGWAVAADMLGPHDEVSLGTAWQPASALQQGPGAVGRKVRINGEVQKSSGTLGAYARIVWLTPAMDRLFAGPASDRRRFLDRLTLAFDPQHNSRCLAFERVMRERNRLLSDTRPDTIWLAGIEDQLAEAAVAIAAARLAAVDALQGFLAKRAEAGRTLPFPRAEIAISGELENRLGEIPAVQVEDEYRRLLHDSRGRDRQAGRTLSGPHRSDLLVTHSATRVEARLCSTGEQKTLLISITLAHARAVRAAFSGWAPLLLLDEIVAHLDAERRDGLFTELAVLGSQAWMTGTDAALFDTAGREFARVTVTNGSISRTTLQ